MAAVGSTNINTPVYWDDVYRREWEAGTILSRRDHGPMHDLIVALVPAASQVLDIGCGPGILCRRIAEEVTGTRVKGIDFSAYTIERNAERDAELRIEYGCVDVRTGLGEIEERFDVVTMCEILEHLDEAEEVVAAAIALVRPGGLFVLSCPHDGEVPHAEHVREWGHDEVFHLLAEHADSVTFHPLPAPRDRWLLAHITTADRPPGPHASTPSDGQLLDRARQATVPSYEVKLTRPRSDGERAAARQGSYEVFDRTVELLPPVDWNQDKGRSWQTQLHSWVFMDVLMQSFNEGDAGAFRQALDLALDWIAQQVRHGAGTSPLAWYDKVVGDRAPYVAYLLRTGLASDLVSDAEAGVLVDSFLEHGRFLADDENYTERTNHGLYQDAGLLLLAKYGDGLFDEAEDWRRRALTRFWRNFALLCDLEDGLYLEHSTAYQFSMITLLTRFRNQGLLGTPKTESLLTRMRETAAWFVTPDDTLAQIGDTDPIPAMPWAKRQSHGQQGMRVFQRGGYAVVRNESSYLAVSSSFHGVQHKHADELSFILFECGERIIVDPGRYAYDETDPFRQFAQLSRAHNVLQADGEFTFKKAAPYRSGILATGNGSEWYAILGSNPLLEPNGVAHERLFLYRPGTALVVVDRVHSAEEHGLTRLFHMASQFETDASGSHRSVDSGLIVLVSDFSVDECALSIQKGVFGPEIQGWEFPGERQRLPAPVVEMSSRGRTTTLVSGIGIGEQSLDVGEVRWTPTEIELIISHGSETVHLALARDGSVLDIVDTRAR